MRARKLSLRFAAAASLVVFWMAPHAAPGDAPAALPQGPLPAAAPTGGSLSLTGTAGCSARGCHGHIDPRPAAVRLDEFPRWLARDKHALAYQSLQGDAARAIAEKLYGKDHPAWEERACLACHTNPRAAVAGASALLQEEQQSGVGCESCHGAASLWLARHTGKDWKGGYGMTPVGDPAAVAETCVGCHVGAPADLKEGLPVRDMNHDMIAAGHPRLTFEFGVFLANLPPHWNEEAKKPDECSGVRAWAVGQVVAAQAALNLLADRAADKTRPWPEFAEYDCFACHHDLSDPSWRRERGYGGRAPGSLPWGGWYFTMPRLLAVRPPFGDPKNRTLLEKLDGLEAAMSTPLKDRDKLSDKAHAVAAMLDLARYAGDGELEQVAARKRCGNCSPLSPEEGRRPTGTPRSNSTWRLRPLAGVTAMRTLARRWTSCPGSWPGRVSTAGPKDISRICSFPNSAGP